VSGAPLRFVLNDGEMLVFSNEERLSQVYELLWQLAPMPGAVEVAAVIRAASAKSAGYGPPLDLNPAQSAALREAIGQLES
jgi:hypothetical protein